MNTIHFRANHPFSYFTLNIGTHFFFVGISRLVLELLQMYDNSCRIIWWSIGHKPVKESLFPKIKKTKGGKKNKNERRGTDTDDTPLHESKIPKVFFRDRSTDRGNNLFEKWYLFSFLPTGNKLLSSLNSANLSIKRIVSWGKKGIEQRRAEKTTNQVEERY